MIIKTVMDMQLRIFMSGVGFRADFIVPTPLAS